MGVVRRGTVDLLIFRGGSFAVLASQMSAPREPNLRLVKDPQSVFGAASENAHGASEDAHDAFSPDGTSALADTDLSPISGEIRDDWTNLPPNTTLMGVGAISAGAPAPALRRKAARPTTAMFVSPATVEAIAKAKREAEAREAEDRKVIVDDTALVRVGPNSLAMREPTGLTRRGSTDVALRDARDTLVDQRPGRLEKWQPFEDLGLAPRPIARTAQKLVVSTYRLLGFGILSLIVFVLVGYIGTTAFYFMNRTWVTPIAISPNDEKIVTLQSQLAAQMNEREKLVAELEQAERNIIAEQEFQKEFAKAIKRDLQGRRVALQRAQQLAQKAASTRAQISVTNGEYSEQAEKRMGDEFAAGMIDRDAMLQGKYQLAQITSANLSLAERQAEFDQRAAELASQTQSLDAILANKADSSALSYDVLKIARDYDASKLALARELSNRERFKTSIERQDQIIEGLKSSAYLRALGNNATVALVPYDNLDNVSKGTPLYACRVSMIVCRKVGTVLDVLPGEVQLKHPKRESVMRGRMLEMQLTEPKAAQHDVLFVGGKPLGF